jgi:hypothetical protein
MRRLHGPEKLCRRNKKTCLSLRKEAGLEFALNSETPIDQLREQQTRLLLTVARQVEFA